jgi:surface protein
MGLDVQGFGFGDGLSFGSFGFHPSTGSVVDTESMIFTVTIPSSAFTFRIQGQPSAASYNYDVDWGDGSSDIGVTIPNKEHVYTNSGVYEIKIKGDIYIRQTGATWSPLYTEFKQWGSAVNITSNREFFSGCGNMTYTATDTPTFAMVGSTGYRGGYNMFYNCDSITSLNLSAWDVSTWVGLTVSGVFFGMNNLEYLNISDWDLSGITGAWSSSINGVGGSTPSGCELIAPNVKLTNSSGINQVFYQSAFSSMNVENWQLNTTSCNINQAFRRIGYNNSAYYGLVDLDVSTWNIGPNILTTSPALLFLECRGIKTINITNWDLRHCTTFNSMFSSATHLEEIIGLQNQRWDGATLMNGCFEQTYKLKFDNYDFSNTFGSSWSVTNFSKCFYRCGYNNPLGDRGVFPNLTDWDTSNATALTQMFRESRWGSGTFSANWDLSNVSTLSLFMYNHVGIDTIDWAGVRTSNTLTDMSSFASYINNGSNPRALTSIRFGANCDFSGVTTWSGFLIQRNACTIVQFDSGVSFAAATTFSNFLTSVPCATLYYDALLVRLDATNTNTGVPVSAQLCQYTLGSAAETSRTQLVTGQSWTITDAGGV